MSRPARALRRGALPLVALLGCATPAPRPAPVPAARAAQVSAPAQPAQQPQPAPPAPPGPVAVASLPPVAAPRPALALPAVVRIGLHTDLEAVTLPCCDTPASAELDGRRFAIAGAVTVRPAAGAAPPPVWRLQVAALREEGEAATLARRLERLGGSPADARFDAASGLYRVRAGVWPSREAAEAAGRTLQGRGLAAFWAVSEGAPLAEPALAVTLDGGERRVPGRRFALRAADGAALAYEGKRYRGSLVVVLNDRGRLNLVNELALEDYLRGVVPSELGPGSYGELEALKAQAVAARSYTLRNLGGFADEGYDLCGTPKCQVYGGLGAEHPLSDRAIAETAGEVLLWAGEPIDALYSATCGGHTEDVEVVFPLKRAPYLRGVSCLEAGLAALPAPAGAAAWPRALLARAVPDLPARIDSAPGLERALRRVAAAAGLEPPADRLASLERAEVRRFLASQLDLALDPRIFLRPQEVAAAAGSGPEGSAADRELAAWLAGVAGPPAAGDAGRLDPAAIEPLLLRLALRLGLLERRSAIFDALKGGDLLVRTTAGEAGYRVDKATLAFRRADGAPRPGALALGAGDPLELWLAGGRLAAVVQELPDAAPALERPHTRATWTRFRSDAEIGELVRQRFPGFDFAGLDVLARGPAGRVGRVRLRGRDGSSVEVAGLAVRWTLDLPDTLFTVRRVVQRGGRRGWQFTGRGWGHGVGLCQYGAWGMARRGLDYRAILAHYYSGAVLERLAPAAGR